MIYTIFPAVWLQAKQLRFLIPGLTYDQLFKLLDLLPGAAIQRVSKRVRKLLVFSEVRLFEDV